ncbi:hypothetical protein P168DRAFT_262285 [Aspergillus campestris IBT 28561]|uniref:Uncharacterized protein n=1 Tax=Aspergillus campestris (strain IBT 28561) TaxID=1392248 RepID=A0A2I1DE25_ASPC2|nr:uncharacterized protein P168DRAFT_262285 [Aspergillus campestris IBT 28561]PKY08139.1 hypothetical protein P168DRAFT_262285 [Aspergillus campestris IBT 28561]
MTPPKKEILETLSQSTVTGKEVAQTKVRKLARKTRLERVLPPVRYALVVLSSLYLSSALFTLSSHITGELGRVSKHFEGWWQVGGLVAWRAVEVGLMWILEFEGRDVWTLAFLAHLPTYALLASFYNIRPTTMLLAYAITVISTAAPFTLLRKSSNEKESSGGTSSNRAIVQDCATTIYTTLAATSIFTVALSLSYATWLPAHLVVHFDYLPDISVVHAGPARLPVLFVALLPAGWAARDFLFVSSAESAAGKNKREGEYLACTVYHKLWGQLSPKTRVLVTRTATLAGMLVLNTVVQIAGTVRGADVEGAAAWGAIWAAAAGTVGATYAWIEAVDGV